MNSSNKLIGTWSYERNSGESYWSENLYDLLNPPLDASCLPIIYSSKDQELIKNTVAQCADTGYRKCLIISANNNAGDCVCHFVDIRPEFNFHESPDRVIVNIYLKPELDELLLDTASPLSNFHSLFNKKPNGIKVYSFDFTCLFIKNCDWKHNEFFEWRYTEDSFFDASMNTTGYEAESRQALERVVSEKRFVMIQVKDGEGAGAPGVLSIYEPVLTEEQEVLYIFNYVYDISDLKERENIVFNQFMAIESAMDGIALLNEKGEYYYLNNSHVKMFGYEVDTELIGKTWQVIYDEAEIERISKDLFPLLMANGRWSGETLGRSKQGEPVLQDISLTALPNGGLVCVCRDISGRKKQEKQLELNDRILRNTNSIVIITNAKREIEWVNEAFTKISEYTLEEVAGKTPGQVLQGKETDPATIDFMKEKLEANEPFSCETINYTKSGKPYWIEIKCQPLFGSNGEVDKYFAIEENITFRKMAEQSVKKTEQRLELAMEASGNAIWDWDIRSQTVSAINWKLLLGFEDHEIGNSMDEFLVRIHPDDKHLLNEAINEYLNKHNDKYECQLRLMCKDGSFIWVIDRSSVVEKAEDGKPLRIIGTTINITALKNTEGQLLLSEEKWKKAVEGTGSGIGEIDLVNRKMWYSQNALNFLGYSDEKEVPDSLDYYISLIHPDDKEKTLALMYDHLKGKTRLFEYEYRLRGKDGQYRWFDFHGIVSRRNAQGIAESFIGSSYDITDRKNYEVQLRLSEERWKFAIDGADAGIWDWDITSNKVYYSEKTKELHGIESGEQYFKPDNFIGFIYQEDTERVKGAIDKLLHGFSDRTEIEYRVVDNHNSMKWVYDRAMVVSRNAEGMATRIIGIFNDITRKKELDEKLLQSEQRWIFALEGSSSGVWDYNLVTGEVFYSNKLKELVGLKPDDPFENNISTWSKLVHPDDELMANEQLQKYFKGEITTYENEQRALHTDGTYHWYLNNGIIVGRNEKGEPTRIIGTATDITSRKQNELDLIKAKELAEASAKTKRAFLANMSHEIRTPMNAILGLSEQLRQTSLSEDQQFLTNIINDAARSLQILIDDILDFSKIEEGKLVLEHIDFDLYDMMRRIMSMLLHKAQEKNISIQLDFDSSIITNVKGDPNRLSQVLINIIGNAIKFTAKGFVIVSCRRIEIKEKAQLIRFSVSDSGIGISEEGLKNIFCEFYQEDQTIARKFGGTGLGLAISHNLISLMNGEISIESKKNIGTDVVITLPMEIGSTASIVSTEEEVVLDKEAFKGKRLLLVEDNKVNRIVATIILKKYGFEIDEAENGRVALELLMQRKYHLILMDLQMPELDGISTVAILRKDENCTPVIALTANAVREELEELLSKGFNDYVIKPFEEKKLLLKIQENLFGSESKGPAELALFGKSDNKGMDIKKALAAAADNQPAIEERFASALLFELNATIDSLKLSIEEKDWIQIKNIAHKQKSMLMTLDIKDDSDTIFRLSALNIDQIVPEHIKIQANAMLDFFERTRHNCLLLYPDLEMTSSN